MTQLETDQEIPQKPEALTEKEWRERAEKTWESLQPFYRPSGMIADRLEFKDGEPKIALQTKPTNLGLGMLAVLSAERLEFISPLQADSRLRSTLKILASLEKHQGFFLDWYDIDGSRLALWPESGREMPRFVSVVDNAWVAASLILVSQTKSELAHLTEPILKAMDFSRFFDASTQELWGGYQVDLNHPSHWHYGREYMSEARLVHHVTAALAPTNNKAEILDRLLDKDGNVPEKTFGGSLFEQLAPTLLVLEPQFEAAHQAEINRQRRESHPDGWWGLSPCDNPNTGKYTEVGVGRYYKNLPIVAPYALFLALKFEPAAVSQMLKRLEANFPVYSPQGYRDSVDVETGKVAQSRLLLDQAMILLAITNHLEPDYFPHFFTAALENYHQGIPFSESGWE